MIDVIALEGEYGDFLREVCKFMREEHYISEEVFHIIYNSLEPDIIEGLMLKYNLKPVKTRVNNKRVYKLYMSYD